MFALSVQTNVRRRSLFLLLPLCLHIYCSFRSDFRLLVQEVEAGAASTSVQSEQDIPTPDCMEL